MTAPYSVTAANSVNRASIANPSQNPKKDNQIKRGTLYEPPADPKFRINATAIPAINNAAAIPASQPLSVERASFNTSTAIKSKTHYYPYSEYCGSMTRYANQGNWQKTQEAFEIALEADILPGIIIFNILINAYVKARKLYAAQAVYWRLIHSGIAPDVVTFNTLIKGYVKEGKLNEAIILFSSMPAARVSPEYMNM